MKMILFEWKKIIRLKVFPIFLQLTFVLVFGLFFYHHMSQAQVPVKKIEYFTELRKDVNQQLLQAEEELKKRPDAHVKAQLHFGTELSDRLNELNQAIQSGDWRGELSKEIEVYETAFEYIQRDSARFGVSAIDMDRIIKLNEELLKRNLPKEDFDLSIQTSIFMKKVDSLLMNPVGFVMLLFVLGLTVTREFDDHTIRQVWTLPVTRIQYLAVKFIALLSAALLWIALIFIVAFALGELLGNGQGNVFNYPLYTEQDTFISSGTYLLRSLLYSISFIAFATGLLLLLSYLFRNTIVTFSALLFIMAGGWLLSSYGVDHLLNPFTYQMAGQAVLKTPDYFPQGIAVMAGALLIVMMGAAAAIRKRGA